MASRHVEIVCSLHDRYEVPNVDPFNRPQERKRAIYEHLASLPDFKMNTSCSESGDWSVAATVHDQGLIDFLRTAWSDWVASGDARDPGFFLRPVSAAAPHDVPYLVPFQIAHRDGLQLPGKTVCGRISYYACDRVTPIYGSIADTLLIDLGIIEESVKALHGANSIVYALTTHPGHHSSSGNYAGYCYINNAAVCARLLQQRKNLRKIAVIDVDYHAGNGTTSIFYDDPTVFVASIHIHPDLDYPYTSGFPEQTGGPNAPNGVLNICLQPKATWAQHYHSALEQAVNAAKAFGAEALVVSLGLDTYKEDPVISPAAGFLIDVPDYREMGRTLGALALPTVVVQEGGYNIETVPRLVEQLLRGLQEA
eukprot:m.108271 g.108271  ORF g.108271 m.108271 type:complete len:367 (+) comp15861_c0_seq2:269-1369(+)